MISNFDQIFSFSSSPIFVLDSKITLDTYCALDLSISNEELQHFDISDPYACQNYIDDVLAKNHSKVAWGGYLEKRNLYDDKASFSQTDANRNIHLGIDFWTKAGTKVITPFRGRVHSFQNNKTIGDYGPTIILQHEIAGNRFHTLYGHLSVSSIENIHIGQTVEAGETIANLGTPDINVNYAPHLHFQIIIDMAGKKGDYPGVCAKDRFGFYSKNCPNPNLLLQIPS